MNQATWTAVDSYISEVMIRFEPVQEKAPRRNTAEELPPIDVTPNLGKLIYLLAKMHSAKRILENGTLGGYSTVWLARALPPDAYLVTLKFFEKYAEVAQANIARGGFAD